MPDPAQSPKAEMPKIEYLSVPTGYPNLVAQLSTMKPLLGFERVEWGLARVAARSKKVRRMVSDRLQLLVSAGFDPIVRKAGSIYHCPPPYAITAPKLRTCRVGHFCPHCWARRAIDAWRIVDDAFFLDPRTRPGNDILDAVGAPLPAFRGRGIQLRKSDPPKARPDRISINPAFDLIERFGVWELPHSININRPDGTIDVEYGVQNWLARRARGWKGDPLQRKAEIRNALAAVIGTGQPWGALEVVKFIPDHRSYVTGNWTMLTYQILLVPRGVTVQLNTHGMRRTESPTREQIARTVGVAFLYPTFLLDSSTPNELVISALQLRQGARLTECFGIFRGRKPS